MTTRWFACWGLAWCRWSQLRASEGCFFLWSQWWTVFAWWWLKFFTTSQKILTYWPIRPRDPGNCLCRSKSHNLLLVYICTENNLLCFCVRDRDHCHVLCDVTQQLLFTSYNYHAPAILWTEIQPFLVNTSALGHKKSTLPVGPVQEIPSR